MPQIYRQTQRPPPPEPRRRSSVAPLQPTDADDSIVLSDLVRTGEASRLRRRGAMRIDHNAARASLATNPSLYVPNSNAPPRPVVVVPSRTPTPPWAGPEPTAEEEYTYAGADWRDWSGEDRGEGAPVVTGLQPDEERRDSEDEEEFILFCGGEELEPAHFSATHGSHFGPSPFPGCPSNSAASASTSVHPAPRTNGCGAVVHMHAYPQRPRGVWIGKEDAADVVVGLDASYFDRSVVAKMMKSACGCVREGIGCSVCGNPLGTRYLPCQAASEGIFTRSSSVRSQAPLRPTGPRYWHCRSAPPRPSSASSRTTPNFYVYTFFADHVTPSRPYAFPTRSIPRPMHVELQAPEERERVRPSSPLPLPLPPPSYYGYRYTASPRPLSPYRALTPAASSSANPAGSYPADVPEPPAPLQLNVRGLDAGQVQAADEDVRMLDADGVARDPDVMEAPSSPDKGNETMVWPVR